MRRDRSISYVVVMRRLLEAAEVDEERIKVALGEAPESAVDTSPSSATAADDTPAARADGDARAPATSGNSGKKAKKRSTANGDAPGVSISPQGTTGPKAVTIFSLDGAESPEEKFKKKLIEMVMQFGVGLPGVNSPWQFGKGLAALHRFYQRLEEDFRSCPEFANAPQKLKTVITNFLEYRKYIAAFHRLVDIFNLVYKSELQPHDDFSAILLGEDNSELVVDDLFFRLYGKISALSPDKSDLAFSELNRFCIENLEDLIKVGDDLKFFYFNGRSPTTATIGHSTSLDDMAHKLFCHRLLFLYPDFYSQEKRELLSALAYYLYNKKGTGCKNFETARILFETVLSSPQLQLSAILSQKKFSKDTIEGQQGTVRQTLSVAEARQRELAAVIPTEADRSSSWSGSITSALSSVGTKLWGGIAIVAKSVTAEPTFVPLLDRYRDSRETVTPNILADSESAVNDFLREHTRLFIQFMRDSGLLALHDLDADKINISHKPLDLPGSTASPTASAATT